MPHDKDDKERTEGLLETNDPVTPPSLIEDLPPEVSESTAALEPLNVEPATDAALIANRTDIEGLIDSSTGDEERAEEEARVKSPVELRGMDPNSAGAKLTSGKVGDALEKLEPGLPGVVAKVINTVGAGTLKMLQETSDSGSKIGSAALDFVGLGDTAFGKWWNRPTAPLFGDTVDATFGMADPYNTTRNQTMENIVQIGSGMIMWHLALGGPGVVLKIAKKGLTVGKALSASAQTTKLVRGINGATSIISTTRGGQLAIRGGQLIGRGGVIIGRGVQKARSGITAAKQGAVKTAGKTPLVGNFLVNAGKGTGAARKALGISLKTERAGFLADALSMDELEGNMFGIMDESNRRAYSPVQSWLMADPSDSEFHNRLRNGVQGVAIGLGVGAAFKTIGAFWRMFRATRVVAELPLGSSVARTQAEKTLIETVDEATRALETVSKTDPRTAKGYNVFVSEDGVTIEVLKDGKLVSGQPAFTIPTQAQRWAASVAEADPLLDRRSIGRIVADRFAANPEMSMKEVLQGAGITFQDLATEEATTVYMKSISAALHKIAKAGPEVGRTAKGFITPAQLAEDISDLSFQHFERNAMDFLSDISARITQPGARIETDILMGRQVLRTLLTVGLLEPAERRSAEAVMALARPLSKIDPTSLRIGGRTVAEESVEGAAKSAPVPRAPDTAGPLAGYTDKEVIGLFTMFRYAEGDPSVMRSLLREQTSESVMVASKKGYEKFVANAQQYRYAAMLSGPPTQIRNIVSNTIVSWARAGGSVLFGDSKRGLLELGGLFTEGFDALLAANKAFRHGGSLVDPRAFKETAMTEMGQWAADRTFGGNIFKYLTLPNRSLLWGDELAKVWNFRANLKATATMDGQRLFAHITDNKEYAKAVSEHIGQVMEAGFTKSGVALDPVGAHVMREATFQESLSGAAKWVQKTMDTNPTSSILTRTLLPFIKTPANLFRYAWRRTPVLWRFSKGMRDDLAGKSGLRMQELAYVRLKTGQAIGITAVGLSAAGKITGGGPRNKEMRRQWLATGKRPYSIQLPTGRWISYEALEPVSTLVGMIADFSTTMHQLKLEEKEDGLGGVSYLKAITFAIAAALENEKFLSSITEVFGLIGASADSRQIGQALQDVAVNSVLRPLIPYNGLIGAMRQDEFKREMSEWYDDIFRALPVLSETLEPQRNVMGRPVPQKSIEQKWMLFETTDPDDEDRALMQQIVDGLGEFVTIPTLTAELKGFDLKDRDKWAGDNTPTHREADGIVSPGPQSPYDRRGELLNSGVYSEELELMLPPIRDVLQAIVDDDLKKLRELLGDDYAETYQLWSGAEPTDLGAKDALTAPDSRRAILIEVYDLYKEAANATILLEYPKLQEAINAQEVEAEQKRNKKELRIEGIVSLPTGPSDNLANIESWQKYLGEEETQRILGDVSLPPESPTFA